MRESINYWAVIVAAIVAFALGFLWFTIIFRDPYLAGLGKTKAQMDAGATAVQAFIAQFIGNLIMIFVLAWLMKTMGYNTAVKGMQLGLIIWTGFVAAVIGPMYAFQAFSLSFYLINTGGVLVYLLAAGAILGAWA